VTRREADKRSPAHGNDFEASVFEEFRKRAERAGDVFDDTSKCSGRIVRNTKGDALVVLGPDCSAAGARIVVEAKADQKFDAAKARAYLDEARKNRDAAIGIFVFSAETACEGQDPFLRFGEDILVVWDANDPRSDVVLDAALSVAKALSVRKAISSAGQRASLEAMDRALLELERCAKNLGDVGRSAQTIHAASQKILDRVRIDGECLTKQLEALRAAIDELTKGR
jgi:hypothetical protein